MKKTSHKKSHKNGKKGGFSYFRTEEQIREYMQVPAERKFQWLEEMRRLNQLVAQDNPDIGQIQEMFRRGEI